MEDRQEDNGIEKIFMGVSKAIEDGNRKEDIVSDLIRMGVPEEQAVGLVNNIAEIRGQNRESMFSEVGLMLREMLFLIVSSVGVCAAAILLSKALGFADAVFNVLGLGLLGQIIVKIGEMAAGLGLAAGASIVARESGSNGVFIGGWIGAALYYVWIFYTF